MSQEEQKTVCKERIGWTGQGPGWRWATPRAPEVLGNLLSLSDWEAAEGSQPRIPPDFQGSTLATGEWRLQGERAEAEGS